MRNSLHLLRRLVSHRLLLRRLRRLIRRRYRPGSLSSPWSSWSLVLGRSSGRFGRVRSTSKRGLSLVLGLTLGLTLMLGLQRPSGASTSTATQTEPCDPPECTEPPPTSSTTTEVLPPPPPESSTTSEPVSTTSTEVPTTPPTTEPPEPPVESLEVEEEARELRRVGVLVGVAAVWFFGFFVGRSLWQRN